eukprot:Skav214873  [mRNA]  locus=C9124645:1005:1931:+ [translate_table: standard]
MVTLAESQAKTLDVAEIFAGVGSIWKAGAASGYNCAGFDKTMDEEMNVFHATGLETMVKMVGRIKPGGLVWVSPDCATFCGLCIHQTQRSLQNPTGNAESDRVNQGNYMAQVSMMLFVLAWMLGAHPVLENPAGNWIWKFPAVTQVFEHIGVWKATLCRCRFSRGFRPKKAYGLAGPAAWIELLNYPCNHDYPHQKLANVETKNGRVQVNGKPKALKDSASYPLKMGQKVIDVWRQNAAIEPATSMRNCSTDEDDVRTGSSQSSWKLCLMDDRPARMIHVTPSPSSSSWKMCEEEVQTSSSKWKTCLE